MSKVYAGLEKAYTSIKKRIPFTPDIALVLGSGLGGFAESLEIFGVIPYSDIPGFPVSTVSGHKGQFIFGKLYGKNIVCMQGRVHLYEGYLASQAVMPVRLMYLMGAKTLILTNAAGGVNESFKPGTLMCITDHISDFVPSPLIGENVDELGTRFPDMSCVYDNVLRNKLFCAAKDLNIPLESGVYIQLSGPNYETPAEIRMVRNFGADAVGMSTVIEAMAAKHAGMRVCGISLITNMAAGVSKTPLSHEEVKETADASAREFEGLMKHFIEILE